MIQTLQEIGVCRENIEAIRHADDENQAKEYTLILIAMFDDRHEYVA